MLRHNIKITVITNSAVAFSGGGCTFSRCEVRLDHGRQEEDGPITSAVVSTQHAYTLALPDLCCVD
jgi:hypothetical protein